MTAIQIFVDSDDDGGYSNEISNRVLGGWYRTELNPGERVQSVHRGEFELGDLRGPLLHRMIRVSRGGQPLFTGFVEAIRGDVLVVQGIAEYLGIDAPASVMTGTVSDVLAAAIEHSAGFLPIPAKNGAGVRRAVVGTDKVGSSVVYPSIPPGASLGGISRQVGLMQAGLRGIQSLVYQLRQLMFFERGFLSARRDGSLAVHPRGQVELATAPQHTIQRRDYQGFEMTDWGSGGQFILDQAVWGNRGDINVLDKTFKIPPGEISFAEMPLVNGLPVLMYGVSDVAAMPLRVTARVNVSGTSLQVTLGNPDGVELSVRLTVTVDGQALEGHQAESAQRGRGGSLMRSQLPGGDLQALQEAVIFHRAYLTVTGRLPLWLHFSTEFADNFELADILQSDNPESRDESSRFYCSGQALELQNGRARLSIRLYPLS